MLNGAINENNPDTERGKIMTDKLTYINLFAGAGGLSEGFIRAGFHPVAHVEMDRYASLTLKTRLGYHYLKENEQKDVYFQYIRREITPDEFYSFIPDEILRSVITMEINENTIKHIFERIESIMKDSGIHKIDVIIGGPPCQAYSTIGRARDPYRMRNDPRNYLYRFYVKFLKKFRPEVFIFENVPGLLSAGNGKLWNDVQKYFRNAGYDIDYRLLNANDFGVLQRRKRVIMIGWEQDLKLNYPEFEKDENVKNYAVGDMLFDLPPLQPGEKMLVGEYISEPSKYLVEYGIRTSEDVLTLHISRKHNERDRTIYKFYIEKWFKNKERPKYDDLPEELKTHKNRNVFKDRFKVVAPDLPYSQTVVAHLSKDGHYFIHPDITQLRSISVREAARLQSFPDNYYFEGPMTTMFRQIGNAVPPLMAEKIAGKIREMLS